MGDATTISWTDATWNVTRGCRRVSPGCENCYAERQANRFAGPGGAYDGLVKRTPSGPRWTGKTIFAADHLADPLRWKAPRRIFVDSMSDLFFEGFTNEQIAAVFGVMAACPQHTFQVLTKRAHRMREWFEWLNRIADQVDVDRISVCCEESEQWLESTYDDLTRIQTFGDRWPLSNVWLGVSVENQEAADERIPDLLRTSAAVRFLSCEPLLGPVDLTRIGEWGAEPLSALDEIVGHVERPPLGWVIAGCESGPGARWCSVEWLRSLRDQCATAGVPFFLKQAVEIGERCDECGDPIRTWVSSPTTTSYSCSCTVEGAEDGATPPIGMGEGSHAKGGRLLTRVVELPYLDGVQHAEFPR